MWALVTDGRELSVLFNKQSSASAQVHLSHPKHTHTQTDTHTGRHTHTHRQAGTYTQAGRPAGRQTHIRTNATAADKNT